MRLGEVVPDVEFRREDGSAVRLSEFGGRPLLLVFLRHLA
jgi:peroxiredoxin